MGIATSERQAALEVLLPFALKIGPPSSLEAYVLATFPAYDIADHHRYIIERLEAVERGDVTRLMIFMPPRRGKSELASVRFPAWYHGRNPERSIIACSHTAELANTFSRQVRDQFGDPDWPFDVRLKRGENTITHWGLTGHRGRHIAAGVGGPITGKGADLLIIDDPVKDDVQAASETYRERLWQWYNKVALTRLAPDGSVVLIMTRWHEDDLAGRLLASGEDWTVVCLREIAEADDPLGRDEGKPLWPTWYPLESTAVLREMPFVWEPLYQQRPGAELGGMFQQDWMGKRYDVLPDFEMTVITVDSAFGEDVANDPTSIAVWGATETGLYLLDDWNDRVAYPALIQAVKDVYAKWEHLAPWLWIENKASGQSAIQTLRAESSLPVMEFNPQGNKVSRAQDASRYFAAGRVYLPNAPWVNDWIAEHRQFPHGKHDDRVDTTSMAVKVLTQAVAVSGEMIEVAA